MSEDFDKKLAEIEAKSRHIVSDAESEVLQATRRLSMSGVLLKDEMLDSEPETQGVDLLADVIDNEHDGAAQFNLNEIYEIHSAVDDSPETNNTFEEYLADENTFDDDRLDDSYETSDLYPSSELEDYDEFDETQEFKVYTPERERQPQMTGSKFSLVNMPTWLFVLLTIALAILAAFVSYYFTKGLLQ